MPIVALCAMRGQACAPFSSPFPHRRGQRSHRSAPQPSTSSTHKRRQLCYLGTILSPLPARPLLRLAKPGTRVAPQRDAHTSPPAAAPSSSDPGLRNPARHSLTRRAEERGGSKAGCGPAPLSPRHSPPSRAPRAEPRSSPATAPATSGGAGPGTSPSTLTSARPPASELKVEPGHPPPAPRELSGKLR